MESAPATRPCNYGGHWRRLVMLMMPVTPRFVVGWVAKRYVAGPDLDSAVRVMRSMKSRDACFTLDVLGEEITKFRRGRIFRR